MKSIFNTLACLLFLGAFIPYARAIWRDRKIPAGTLGKAEPRKATWLIWAILDGIILAGMYFKGTINGQIIGANIGAWVIVVLAMRYGTSGWPWLDRFCLGGAFLGITLWQIFNDATFGILTSCTVLLIGAIPTFVSVWRDPGRENKLAWTIFWISCVCAMVAIPNLTFGILLSHPVDFLINHLPLVSQPLTFFTIESVVMLILLIRPLFIRGKG